ncbi:hypothetical protein KR032_004411, partial [Drosophila birchii]
SVAPLGYLLLLVLALYQTSLATATTGVIPALPAAVPGAAAAAVPATVVPLATSHQFVTRNWNRNVYVPTSTYPPTTYYKYSGGYPSYPQYPVYNYPYASTYQYTYPYYYPTYNYGYGYRGVW